MKTSRWKYYSSSILGTGHLLRGRGGGLQNEFNPYKKRGGGGKCFGHAEGGRGTTSFEVVLIQELSVLAIVIGGAQKSFHPLKGGPQNVLPCLEGGGGRKMFLTHDFPFCSSPSPYLMSLSSNLE